ncbi:NUDIX domain-containing protein [Aeromicrobium sp. 179-A 4D2 NHS]|uniref:NUDIX domain-containing protein n=1 Tax=Aeromicrobium sp. 179-A 4D2 NHS TaxID=3142375 RepID=UPI0039A29A1C
MNDYVPSGPDEAKFLAEYDPKKYPVTMVTVDVLIGRVDDRFGEVLLIQRGNYPFKDHWALPGGFVDAGETTAEAASRELREETGIDIPASELRLMTVADKPGRDPRGHAISIVYVAVAPKNVDDMLAAGDDAADARWVHPNDLSYLPIAFDHRELIHRATA